MTRKNMMKKIRFEDTWDDQYEIYRFMIIIKNILADMTINEHLPRRDFFLGTKNGPLTKLDSYKYNNILD